MSLTTIDGLDEIAKRERGRPTKMTKAVAKEICDRIALGESVRNITRDDHMPSEMTLYRWVNDDRDGFGSAYAEARIRQAWRYQDEIMDIADDGSNDYVTRTRQDGTEYEAFDTESYMRSRLRVDTRKWYLAKVLPKVFGEKIQHDHTGSLDVNVRAKPDADLNADLARMMARVSGGVTDVVDETDGNADEGSDG